MANEPSDAEIEVAPAMIEAGVERLNRLLQAGTSSAYVVTEVFRAMAAHLPPQAPRHWSSCAVHNEPAYPAGECDCGTY